MFCEIGAGGVPKADSPDVEALPTDATTAGLPGFAMENVPSDDMENTGVDDNSVATVVDPTVNVSVAGLAEATDAGFVTVCVPVCGFV